VGEGLARGLLAGFQPAGRTGPDGSRVTIFLSKALYPRDTKKGGQKGKYNNNNNNNNNN